MAGDVERQTSAGPGSEAVDAVDAPLAAAGLVVIPDRFRPVLDELSPLTERFAAAGHRLYLVGGTVRDLLIADDRDDYDFDATTTARPDDIKACLDGWADAVWTQGERFGTIGAKKDGRTYEITTHRAEAYDDDSRKPHVEFADDIEADLSRRDFTINAMALELTSPTPDARRPVRRRRRPGDTHAAHAAVAGGSLQRRPAADAARGAVHRPLSAAAGRRAGRGRRRDARVGLEIVSAERIRDELDKLITRRPPERRAVVRVDTGLAEEFLPELPAMRLEQDPIHRHKDVLTHTIAVVENVAPRHAPATSTSDALASPRCSTTSASRRRVATSKGKGVTFHHHDAVGARMTRKRMEALRYSQRRHRGGHRARGPAPALPHLPDGLDRLGRAPLRARRRRRCSTS